MEIWTYWKDKPGTTRTPFYQLCLDSILRHNPRANILTPGLVRALGGDEPLDAAAGLPIAIESDLVRAWVLAKYGGVWVDADTICLQPIAAALPEAAAAADLTCVRNPHGAGWSQRATVASPYAARPGSPLAWYVYQAALLHAGRQRSGEHVPWGTTSCGVLSIVAKQHADQVCWLHHTRWHPVPSGIARRVFFAVGPRQAHVAKLHPSTVVVHLSNPIPDRHKEDTREQILAGNSYVSHLFQLAFGLGPAIAPRTRAILCRLPTGPTRMAEVGVFQARNAVQLLQQRPELQLLAVDAYGQHEASYATTADYQVKFPQQRWASTRAEAAARLRWAGDRVEWSYLPSVQAAAAVPDGSLDLVFIDGDHSEAAVRRDLAAWHPKVRPGGWIGGHDYKHPRARQRGYGVDAAVDGWASETRSTVETGSDTTWFARV
jgi:hypothetical protein